MMLVGGIWRAGESSPDPSALVGEPQLLERRVAVGRRRFKELPELVFGRPYLGEPPAVVALVALFAPSAQRRYELNDRVDVAFCREVDD